ncbi:hypothetical protein SNEBB_010739 [Seison nebaliae]|nr:hypothetical protein SNEBB_010739 [Seison nebaliae]
MGRIYRAVLKYSPLTISNPSNFNHTDVIINKSNIDKWDSFVIKVLSSTFEYLNLNYEINITNKLPYGLENNAGTALTGIAGMTNENYDVVGILKNTVERERYLDFSPILYKKKSIIYDRNNKILNSPFGELVKQLNFPIFLISFIISIIVITLMVFITSLYEREKPSCKNFGKKLIPSIFQNWINIFGNLNHKPVDLSKLWNFFKIFWWIGNLVLSSQLIANFICAMTKAQVSNLNFDDILFKSDIKLLVMVNGSTEWSLKKILPHNRIVPVVEFEDNIYRLEKENVGFFTGGDYDEFFIYKYCSLRLIGQNTFFPDELGFATKKGSQFSKIFSSTIEFLRERSIISRYRRTQKNYGKQEKCDKNQNRNIIYFSQLTKIFLIFSLVNLIVAFMELVRCYVIKFKRR